MLKRFSKLNETNGLSAELSAGFELNLRFQVDVFNHIALVVV